MIGNGWWATGITLSPRARGWSVSLSFFDDGFCEGDSTEGELRLRYVVNDVEHAIDVLIEDATRFGISWHEGPHVYVEGDGGTPGLDYPNDWREVADDQARRLGWESLYGTDRRVAS